MAKQTGLGQALYIGGVDVSSEARQWDVSSPLQTLDTTGLRSLANERIGGQKAAAFKWTSHFDPVSAGYAALSALPTGDKVVSMCHRETIGEPVMNLVTKLIDYGPTRDDKGQVLFAVDTVTNDAFADWGVLATPGQRVDTAATNGAGVDLGAAPPHTFGLQAYVQVVAFTGTNITVKLQGSSDDGVGDAYADIVGGGFTAVTAAPAAQKIATARGLSVERYVRVATTGTFTSCTFLVAVVVNEAQVDL